MTVPRHHHARGLGLTSASMRSKLLNELRLSGIHNEKVLEVMGRIARHEFVEEAFSSEAYKNRSLPIGHAQTISQPFIVALMTQAALGAPGTLKPRRVLEVGTGSGYQTAVLAELVEAVFTVERIRPLTESARQRLQRLGYRNVHFGYADGMQGWMPYAPYDAIVVTAAAQTVPASLPDQLAPTGRLVIPVGAGKAQKLLLIERHATYFSETVLSDVTFVPLLAGRI